MFIPRGICLHSAAISAGTHSPPASRYLVLAIRWVKHARAGRRGLDRWSSPNCERIVIYFPDALEYQWRWATACVPCSHAGQLEDGEVVPSIEDGDQQVHVVTELPLLHRRVVSFA